MGLRPGSHQAFCTIIYTVYMTHLFMAQHKLLHHCKYIIYTLYRLYKLTKQV